MNCRSVLFTIIGIISALSFAPNAVLASDALAKAQKAFDHGSFAEVNRILEHAQNADENLLLARNVQVTRSNDAISAYMRASKLSQPPRREVFEALALLSGSRSSLAYDVIKPTFAKFSSNPEVMSTYGRCLCTMQQSEEGLDLMRKARAKDPASSICLDNLSTAAKLNFATADSLKSLADEIAVKPYSVPMRLRRAIIYSESGKIKESLADFAAALKENPDCQYTYYQRATVYRNLRQYDKALADLVRSEKCTDKDKLVSQRVLRLKIDCDDHAHNVKTAVADSQALTDSFKGLTLSRGMRADIFHRVALLEKQNKYQAALDAMTPLMRDFADRSEVMTVRARLFNELKRYREALILADKLVSRDDEMWEWHQIRGTALAGLNDQTRALTEFAKARKLKADYSDLPAQLQERIK